MNKQEVIVVGGGLAGLSACMKLAEKGCFVHLISVTKVKRSHSVCAQGGINAAMNRKNEEDSPIIHAYDTIKGGDFLADQPPVLEMCLAAPGIIRMMERLGCPFSRTPEGNIDFRRFGGTLYHRTAFCGASTGQQLLYALDEQVRRYEVLGLVRKYEHHEFLRLVLDDNGTAKGIVMMNLHNLQLQIVRGDAVIFGTGGPGLIFKKSTNSTFCTGAANGRLFMQGMHYANGEFIQVHPTAIPAEDKLRLISESSRGEGGRIWVYGNSSKTIKTPGDAEIPCGITGQPWYFLEELYPAFGNLVPRDIASREILRICEMGLGIDGKDQVYLDVSHLSSAARQKIASVLDIYQKFTGHDPHKVPMKIYPAVHYSMGGAWIDWPAADDKDRETRFRQMTNLRGCFQVGESEFAYHGANRLGANSLLSCIFGGLTAANEVVRYTDTLAMPARELPGKIFSESAALEEKNRQNLLQANGTENVHKLHDELSSLMMQYVSVKRSNPGLQKAIEGIVALKERYQRISLDDRGSLLNQTYQFACQLGPMLEIAHVIALGALMRNESRGAHYKEEFPLRDDENWLKTTVASYSKEGPKIHYQPVDIRHLAPMARDYSKAIKVHPTLENIPQNITLPV